MNHKSNKPKKQKTKSRNLAIGIGVIIVVAVIFLGFYGNSIFDNPEKETIDNSSPDSNEKVTENVLAEVNDEEITQTDVQQIQQSFSQQGQQLSQENAIEQAINQELIYQKAQQNGYGLTKSEAEESLKSELAKQNRTLEDYKQQLQKVSLSYEEQLSQIKEQIAIQSYLQNNVKIENVTEEESRQLYEDYKSRSNSSQQVPSYDQSRNQIRMVLQQQKQQQAINSLVDDLRKNADIVYE